ncbi:MAG: phospholipid carrier-dependent glycosyltransferase [Nitrospiraceae bacterium]|nr:phospholipid carrier-dependent glycosyltransferase [Nitrospiraceae bacterium]
MACLVRFYENGMLKDWRAAAVLAGLSFGMALGVKLEGVIYAGSFLLLTFAFLSVLGAHRDHGRSIRHFAKSRNQHFP